MISDTCTSSITVLRLSLSLLAVAEQSWAGTTRGCCFRETRCLVIQNKEILLHKTNKRHEESDLPGVTREFELGPGEDGLVLGFDVGSALGEVDGLLLGELDTPGPGDVLCPEDAPGEGLHPQRAFIKFCSTSAQGSSAHGMLATVHEQISAKSPGPTAF